MKKLYTILMAVALVFLLGMGYTAHAATITFDYTIEFSGATPPAGEPPWLTATFVETGADEVTLTMDTEGLVDNEFVTGWYFNFDDDPTALAITYSSGTSATSVDTGSNSFQADGDGKFDILFEYPDAAGDSRFGAAETSVTL